MCNGERRIRVLTLALLTTESLSNVFASADQQAITAYFTHKAVEQAFGGDLESARDTLQSKLVEILQAYHKELAEGSVANRGLQLPVNLRGLTMLFLALMKNVSGICHC